MRVLLTGASSFTGSHFAEALVAAGHQVTATFRAAAGSYTGLRADRVTLLDGLVDCIWNTGFGDDAFVELVTAGQFDILCHHGAEMTNYRSWDFDTLAATAANTLNARAVFGAFAAVGGRGIVVTGSVFEPFEGIGDPLARAFNPYGLAKHLSFEVLRLEAERVGTGIGKFVIPNPFGPREEARFTSFLAREWIAGRTPVVQTPAYVRDNIPVDLLASSYERYVGQWADRAEVRATPSGYVESQGAFALRMSRELAPRLGLDCAVLMAEQRDFAEPMMRINPGNAAHDHPEWSEPAAWDLLAEFYLTAFGKGSSGCAR